MEMYRFSFQKHLTQDVYKRQVEITQNMGLEGISRIEEYFPVKDENADYDPMLQRMYKGLDQNVFTTCLLYTSRCV